MPPGHRDPGRRELIARSAIAVVSERGVEGLTHRAVAAQAGLPLGSTTYHFKSLEDLLAVAISEAKAVADEELEEWVEGLGPDPDLAAELTEQLVRWTGPQRSQAIVEYELYLAALRRPSLRQLAHEWDKALPERLVLLTDRSTADLLGATSNGLILQSLIHGEQLRAAVIEPMLRRILT